MNTPTTKQYDLTPQSYDQLLTFCEMVSQSGMVPKDYISKPANIMVAVQMGNELGLKPLQSLQNISVINGRPSIWGDALIALIKNHPICESIKETFNEDFTVANCEVVRKGDEPVARSFSMSDAQKAALLGKDNWTKYPKRMLQLRARAWALRDVFPDVLCGMQVAEEQQDKEYEAITEVDMEKVNATLKPLGLSTYKKDGMLIVSGNTYNRGDILNKLGFAYAVKKWFINLPVDLSQDAKAETTVETKEEVKPKVKPKSKTTKTKTEEVKDLPEDESTITVEVAKEEPKTEAKEEIVKKAKVETVAQAPVDTPIINNIDDLKSFVTELGFKYSLDDTNVQKWLLLEKGEGDVKKHEKVLRAVGFSNYPHKGVALNITDLLAKSQDAVNNEEHQVKEEDDGLAFA